MSDVPGSPTQLSMMWTDFLLRHHWSRRRYRIDSQREAIHLADNYAFSRGDIQRGDGVPDFSVDEDFSARRQGRFGDTDFPNQPLLSGHNLVAPGAHSDAHQKCGNQAERNSDRKRRHEPDSHLRNRAIDQQEASND